MHFSQLLSLLNEFFDSAFALVDSFKQAFRSLFVRKELAGQKLRFADALNEEFVTVLTLTR